MLTDSDPVWSVKEAVSLPGIPNVCSFFQVTLAFMMQRSFPTNVGVCRLEGIRLISGLRTFSESSLAALEQAELTLHMN